MVTQYDDKGKIYTQVVQKRPVAVTVQTDKHAIRGTLHVRPDMRVKDELNAEEDFLALTGVTIYNEYGEELYKSNFVVVNSKHIVWVIPEEEFAPPVSE